MILSTKCNPVHCSAHPRIQAIKPLAFPPPQCTILADGTFVPYSSSSSKSYTALWKSLPPPFPCIKTDCSPVSTFPVASQTETVFFCLSAPPPLTLSFIPRPLLHGSKMAAAAPDIASVVQGGAKNRRRKGSPWVREGIAFSEAPEGFCLCLVCRKCHVATCSFKWVWRGQYF